MPPSDAAALAPSATAEWIVRPGVTPYDETLDGMRRHVAAIRNGTAGEQVWSVEHPPTFTAGTSARAADLFNPQGFPTFEAGRGGQWTYHGPGQRVVYPLLDLARRHGSVPARDVRGYVQGLERWLILALDRLGVVAGTREGRVGVWVATPVGEAKIGAIGVRVTRWVSWHGVSLNIAPDLTHFGGIVPCGIREYGVTSLAALGAESSPTAVDAALRAAWAEVFGS